MPCPRSFDDATYAVSVKAPGFKRYERTGITLDSNDVVRVDPTLQVGQVNESVTVERKLLKWSPIRAKSAN